MNKNYFTSAIFIIVGIFIASNLYTMLPISPLLVEEFSISIEQSPLASFSFTFCYAIGLLVFGILTDRFGERPILLYGMFSLAILTFFIVFLENYYFFVVARAFQGFLAASFAPPAFSYIFQHFKGKTQTLSIALINTGFLFAGIFGQIFSFYLVYTFTFSALFFAFSFLYFASFVLLFLSLKKTRVPDKKLRKGVTSILTLIRHTPLYKLYMTTFFLLLTIMLFYGGFEMYLLQNSIHLPFSIQTFRIIGLIGIMPAFFANRLVERFNPKAILSGSLLLMSFGYAFSVFYLSEWMLLVSSIFMIASTSLTIPMVIMLVGTYAPLNMRGRGISIYSFILLIGGSVGSLLAAFIPLYYILISIAMIFLCLSFLIRSIKT